VTSVDSMRGRHRHADDMTARGVAGWMGCTRCQHGTPVTLSAAAAEAIAAVLQSMKEGGDR
jgi:hypothetical protein